MSSIADTLLMQKVRDGDVEKLGVLFERYHKMLYNFFLYLTNRKDISEDLVQEVFFRMLKYRQTYQGHSKFTTWMYKIARNACVDFFRKQKREEPLDDAREVPISKAPLHDAKLEQEEDYSLLRAALARLPLRKREVLVLSRFHNMKYAEIAELLGCRTGTVKVHVHRAIKELREIYINFQEEKPHEM